MRGKTLTTALVGLFTAGALALVPLTTTADAAPAATAPAASTAFKAAPVDWKRCKDQRLRESKAQCGFLTVPLDHANPAGPTIRLAVSRVLHTSKSSKGAIFTNPGGPGGSGQIYSILGEYVPGGVGQSYDWYGMDPRGVGSSEPALTCDSKYFGFHRQPYQPKTQEILNYWIAKTDKYAADCGVAAAASLLPHVKTTDTVADFELLRQSIGETQITWYGFSYGTYIGQVYATQHPGSIKAMILDGVVDASRAWYPANLDQDKAFDKAFDRFFKWVGKNNRYYHLGKTAKQVSQRVAKLEKKLAKKPADGKIGPAEFEDSILVAGYVNFVWPDVAQAIADLANDGNAKATRKAYRDQNPSGKGADNGYAMYLATECSEAPWPKDWNIWAADNAAADAASPFFAWANAWFNAPCRNWPVAGSAQPFQVNGAAFTGPVLLTAETYDAATPFAGALATRALFANSALIEGKGGTSHAVSLSGVACTDNAIAKLLKNGKLPSRKAGNVADKKCPGLGAPVLGQQDADRVAAAKVLARVIDRVPFLG